MEAIEQRIYLSRSKNQGAGAVADCAEAELVMFSRELSGLDADE